MRHRLFGALLIVTILVAGGTLHGAISSDGVTPGEALLLILYANLLGWVSVGFWLCVFGAFDAWRNRAAGPGGIAFGKPVSLRSRCRIALLIPIYHENAAQVFDRVRVMFRSLERTAAHDRFEFFVLSDSQNPVACREEEQAWLEACRDLDGFGRIFYRRRARNEARKSGNIQDFCRKWGGRYEYLVVLDADSLMHGRTLVEMVRRMAANPRLALLQTRPIPVNGRSLFARIQQFSGTVYGMLLARGLGFVQMAAGTYWGHNAILRTAAFIDHCALPRLPGRGPLGGEILSHDFVEAALLLRAGWEVRLDADLVGSYEEGPPNIIEHARRDRRWCQGNLQHARLLLAKGLHPNSRLNFLFGIMSYVSAPIWLAFIAMAELAARGTSGLQPWERGIADQGSLLGVLILTALLLLGPKLIALGHVLLDRRGGRGFGRSVGVVASVLIETLFSAVLAPIMMLLHTRFLISILSGRDAGWGPQQRSADDTGWRDAARAHAAESLIGTIGIALVASGQLGLGGWLLPVLVPLTLAIPLSVYSSRVSAGRAARNLGLFSTWAEREPSDELVELSALARARRRRVPGRAEAARVSARATGVGYWTNGHRARPAGWPGRDATNAKPVGAGLGAAGPAGPREGRALPPPLEPVTARSPRKTLGAWLGAAPPGPSADRSCD